MTFFGFLPFFTLILACVSFARQLGEGSLRRGVLRVALVWGAASVFSLELLSLFRAVTQPILIGLWGGSSLILLALAVRGRVWTGWVDAGRNLAASPSRVKLLTLGVAVAGAVTGLVAWLAPPSTWDSLNYHMPRVAHWAQLQAVRHFPTGIEIQNSMPPASEMLVLQSYVLAQGDRWANFVQWFAMVGSLVGVSFIARQLGLGRAGQWAAVAFAASLPTGIIQASSTMTDYVVGLWVIVVAVEALTLIRRPRGSWPSLLWISLPAGMAILTKPVAFAFLLPFAIFVAWRLWRDWGLRWMALGAVVAVAVVLIVNAGHWRRNARLYGHPISSPDRIQEHSSPWLGGRAFISNLVRNTTMHAGTPSPHINKAIALGVQEIHDVLGLGVNDPRTTATGIFKIRWSSKNEDKATNPLHAALIAISVVALLWNRRRFDAEIKLYIGLMLGAWLAFSLLFEWQLYAGRYHTPFFVLMGAAVAAIGSKWLTDRWLAAGGLVLIVAAWPWLFQVKSRPIVPDPGESYTGSVLTTPRQRLYFANGPYLEGPYGEIADTIRADGCESVRLNLPGAAAEYPLWVLLDAPRSGVHVGWSVAGTPSAALTEALPPACAVVCHDCPGDQALYHDLELAMRRGNYSLFLER